MDFYDVIYKRRSIYKYKGDKVNKESLDRMINAAMMSPSWKNRSSYKLILIDDNKLKDSISEEILNKDDKASKAIKDAPMVVVIVACPEKSGEVAGKEYYLVDAAIAMEHFILAATAESYSTCWIGAFDEDNIRSILNVPSDYRVVAMTPLGIGEDEKEYSEKKDIKEYVFTNQWQILYSDNK
ncbi:nitroreductase [Clostridium polyendosporum]|uniref:Nitroreductase n=1 Tax=Clostridium polyendosporum TaxID=69208 RepID=A0A919VFS0_9CLOT|nr:nitroreductase family protein [Clostridium polyendosporum]GIM28710.1 nitroreductase [Clostridium polyendosporum]